MCASLPLSYQINKKARRGYHANDMKSIEKLQQAAKKYRYIVGETEQLEAVRQNSLALQHCHEPSEAVMLAAVQRNGDALRYAAKWL